MNRGTWALVFLGVAVLIGLFVFFLGGRPAPSAVPDDSGAPEDYGTRDPGTYVGVGLCQGCHQDRYTEWRTTRHGLDFTNYDYHGVMINKINRSGGSCAPCHTVGYGNTAEGGFNPAQAWNSTNNIKLLGIQCENCHGPGSDHNGNPAFIIGKPTVEQSCYGTGPSGGCHGPQWNGHYAGWNESAHSRSLLAAGGMVATNTRCQPCHVREAFINELEGTSDPWTTPNPVDCALCHDPHEKYNEAQLRLPKEELCAECHTMEVPEAVPGPTAVIHHPQAEMNAGWGGTSTTMTSNMAGITCADCHIYTQPEVGRKPISDYVIEIPADEGHDFTPGSRACVACHNPDLMNDIPAWAKPVNRTTNATRWDAWEAWGARYEDRVQWYDGIIESWQSQVENRSEDVSTDLEAVRLSIVAANATGNVDPARIDTAWILYYEAEWDRDFVEADGSRGVHNIDYAMALLNDAERTARSIAPLLVPMPAVDTDGDGTPDATDTDDDGDGRPDASDPYPLVPQEFPKTPAPFDPTMLWIVIGLLGALLVVVAVLAMRRFPGAVAAKPPAKVPKAPKDEKE